jgi:hypothetical protein
VDIIEQLIFNALARRQAIALPGFGTLSVTVGETLIDTRTNELVPPRHVLAFTTTPGAETVVGQMIAGAGLTPVDADSIYKHWLVALKKGETGGDWAIEGVCRIEPEGASYRVTAAPALDRMLNPFDVQRIPLVVQKKGVPAWKKEKIVGKESSSASSTGKAKWKPARRWAWIVLCILGAAALGAGCWVYFTETDLVRLLFSPTSATESVIQLPVVPLKTETPPASVHDLSAVDSTAVLSQAQPQTQPAVTGDGTLYHLVVGVFSTEENSRRYMQESGFAATLCRVIPTSKGLYMASVGTYASEEEADAQRTKISTTHPEAWVFKQPVGDR